MEKQYQYNSVEEALEELRQGRIVLVTDDPDRENEGDMICAAEFATQENINFMACHAKGLICTPMSAALAGQLGLPQMVSENTDNHSTAFTVSVDHVDTTTGISAAERGYTMRSLTEEGYIVGLVFPASIGSAVSVKVIDLRITQKGIEFLQENSMMKKAAAFLKTIKETVPCI